MSDLAPDLVPRFRGQPNIRQYPAGASSQLVYCPITGDTQIVSSLNMQLIERCQTFASLDEHAVRLCNELGYGPLHVGATKKILVELAESGLLIAEQGLTEKLVKSPQFIGDLVRADLDPALRDPDPVPPDMDSVPPIMNPVPARLDSVPLVSDSMPPISSIGVPTRDRPHDLERCIRSYAQCSAQYDRKMTFMIADQSSNTEMRRMNLDMLARLQAELGVEILYAGVDEKRDFAKRLSAHCGIAPDVVSFALVNDENCRVDTGINRNALLLSTLGQLTMQVDDDSICRLMPCPESKAGLAVDSRFSVYEYWFPTEDEIAKLGDQCTDENFFALHERILGQSVPNCVDRFANTDLILDGASADFLRKPPNDLGSVVATSLGVAGDSGVGSSHYYLTLDGEERARLLKTESSYRYSMLNHKVIRSVRRATISDVAFCSGLNLGLDNRRTLPPFLPVQRGQDCIFTNLLHVCLNSAYTGFLPWAILHRQSAPAKFSQEDLRKRIVYRSSGEIIERLVKGLAPRPNRGSDRENMVALGEAMREWGTAPLADFEGLLRGMMWEEMSRGLTSLKHSLASYEGQPRFWADDVNRALSWLNSSLIDDKLVIAEDLREVFGLEEARTMLQRLVRRFGELLKVWPDLRDGAKELHEREVYLPTRIMPK